MTSLLAALIAVTGTSRDNGPFGDGNGQFLLKPYLNKLIEIATASCLVPKIFNLVEISAQKYFVRNIFITYHYENYENFMLQKFRAIR